ncbi:kinase-like domain-containing protein [Globomyces pollinis-pini]|nr:kinase-like domain-containing protein [Globomyces pollinis-pini]
MLGAEMIGNIIIPVLLFALPSVAQSIQDIYGLNAKLLCSSDIAAENTNATLNVINTTPRTYRIYWKDSNCTLQLIDQVKSLATLPVESYPKHSFVAVNDKGIVDFTYIIAIPSTGNKIIANWELVDSQIPKVTTEGPTRTTTRAFPTTASISATGKPNNSSQSDTISNTNNSTSNLLIICGLIVLVLAILVGFLIFCFRYRNRSVDDPERKLPSEGFTNNHLNNNSKESTNLGLSYEAPIPFTSITPGESTIYDSRLVIRKKLAGSGGCGQVYKANYANRDAVAKIPILEIHEKLVYEESQMMRRLDSPWTVQVLHFMSNTTLPIPGQEYTPQTALLLEFMNLGSLSQYIKTLVPISQQDDQRLVLGQTLSISTMAAKGIKFIHEQGFNHLDIKPDNVLLNRNADNSVIAKISDFGSTRPEGSYDAVFQTPGYVPPEGIVQPNQMILPQRTSEYDIYAFGGTLINIVLLENYAALWSGVKKSLVQKRTFLEDSISDIQLLDLITSCLEDEPLKRPTAAEVVKALSVFDQSTFAVRTFNDLVNQQSVLSKLTKPLQEFRSLISRSTLVQANHDEIVNYTGGTFLFTDLKLSQSCNWDTFYKSFKHSFELDNNFDEQRFKRRVNPISDIVNPTILNNGIFSNIRELLSDSSEDVKQIWIDDFMFVLDALIREHQGLK